MLKYVWGQSGPPLMSLFNHLCFVADGVDYWPCQLMLHIKPTHIMLGLKKKNSNIFNNNSIKCEASLWTNHQTFTCENNSQCFLIKLCARQRHTVVTSGPQLLGFNQIILVSYQQYSHHADAAGPCAQAAQRTKSRPRSGSIHRPVAPPTCCPPKIDGFALGGVDSYSI